MQAEAQPGLKFNEVERKAEESEAMYVHTHICMDMYTHRYFHTRQALLLLSVWLEEVNRFRGSRRRPVCFHDL